MTTMNISLPGAMRDFVQGRIDDGHYADASDYVRDLIRRDQTVVSDAERWLQGLDAGIAESLVEMGADGGIDLDTACKAALSRIRTPGGTQNR